MTHNGVLVFFKASVSLTRARMAKQPLSVSGLTTARTKGQEAPHPSRHGALLNNDQPYSLGERVVGPSSSFLVLTQTATPSDL